MHTHQFGRYDSSKFCDFCGASRLKAKNEPTCLVAVASATLEIALPILASAPCESPVEAQTILDVMVPAVNILSKNGRNLVLVWEATRAIEAFETRQETLLKN